MNGYNSLNFHLRKDGTCKKSTVTINMIDYSGITHCEIIINKSKTQRNIIIFFIIKVVEKYRNSHEQNNHCTSDLFNLRTYISCFSYI